MAFQPVRVIKVFEEDESDTDFHPSDIKLPLVARINYKKFNIGKHFVLLQRLKSAKNIAAFPLWDRLAANHISQHNCSLLSKLTFNDMLSRKRFLTSLSHSKRHSSTLRWKWHQLYICYATEGLTCIVSLVSIFYWYVQLIPSMSGEIWYYSELFQKGKLGLVAKRRVQN